MGVNLHVICDTMTCFCWSNRVYSTAEVWKLVKRDGHFSWNVCRNFERVLKGLHRNMWNLNGVQIEVQMKDLIWIEYLQWSSNKGSKVCLKGESHGSLNEKTFKENIIPTNQIFFPHPSKMIPQLQLHLSNTARFLKWV